MTDAFNRPIAFGRLVCLLAGLNTFAIFCRQGFLRRADEKETAKRKTSILKRTKSMLICLSVDFRGN